MYTRLGLTLDPTTPGYSSPTGLTPEEELAAICRYQRCGSSLCPCPAGMPTGTVPGRVQQLPELTVTAPKPPWWLLGVAIVALAAGRGSG